MKKDFPRKGVYVHICVCVCALFSQEHNSNMHHKGAVREVSRSDVHLEQRAPRGCGAINFFYVIGDPREPREDTEWPTSPSWPFSSEIPTPS